MTLSLVNLSMVFFILQGGDPRPLSPCPMYCPKEKTIAFFNFQKKEQTIMCEANAYLKDGENEVLFMESVDTIEPYENGLKLMDIFGKQMFIQAKIKDMKLLNHRILLEKIDI